jgi:hypothetical protein
MGIGTMDNTALLGKFVSWPNIGDPDTYNTFIGCGRGEVIAVLADAMLLIRKIPRKGDPEPSYMLSLPAALPNLHFFNTLKEEEKWYNWVMSDSPSTVLKIVK